jgi:hypothetical protein
VPGQGWENTYSGAMSSGFVVMWSSAPKRISSLGTAPAVPPPVVEAPLPPALVELEGKAKQLLANLEKDRDKELAANAKTFHWDLDTWLNDLSKNEISAWRRDVAMLKQSVRDNRVPAKIPSDGGFRMSEQMRKVATYCAQKQQAIDDAFESKASKIRDSYVTRMNAALADAAPDVAATIKRRVDAASDLDRWTASLGVAGAETVALEVEFEVLSAIYGTGGKDADVTERVRELLIKERRAFRVSPGDLGADPNPGWNKGLTVKYTLNGTEGSKSWGENSEVKPEDFIPEGGAIVDAAGKTPLVGVWKWFNGVSVVVWKDGSAFATNGNVGKWEEADGSKEETTKRYSLEWFGVSTDAITIGSDTDRLTGKPVGATQPFECTRVPAQDLKKSPEPGADEDPVVGSWLWTRGGQVILLKDGTVQSVGDGNTGTWKLVSDKGGKRKYEVEWPRDKFLDALEMHESGRALNGRSNGSWDTHAIRLPD